LSQVYFLTRYDRSGASSRVRCYDYIDSIREKSIKQTFQEHPFYSSGYIDVLYNANYYSWFKHIIRTLYLINGLLSRFFLLFKIKPGDTVYIEKEVIPYLPMILEKIYLRRLFGCLIIYDFDDNVFEYYKGNYFLNKLLYKKKSLPRVFADKVIAGNPCFSKLLELNFELQLIYSSFKTNNTPAKHSIDSSNLIGWIGSPSSMYNLEVIIESVKMLKDRKFLFCGISRELFIKKFGFAPSSNIEFLEWTKENEVVFLQRIDLGIMPLRDDIFEHYKCGYKIIQYYSRGIPALVSPIGINSHLVNHLSDGIHVEDNKWLDTLQNIESMDYSRYSLNAWRQYKNKYSWDSQFKIWKEAVLQN
jgi:glycosyltransferase involved in cell wall biosynthesis